MVQLAPSEGLQQLDTSWSASPQTSPSYADPLGPPVAWGKQRNRDTFPRPAGKCMSDLSPVLVSGPRSLYRLSPGPMLELGRKFQSLLIIPNQPDLMARRWAGQWDHRAIDALRPEIAHCTRKQIKAVLSQFGRITSSTAAACWREFSAMARELSPLPTDSVPPRPLADGQTSTIDWDPRLGEDHG